MKKLHLQKFVRIVRDSDELAEALRLEGDHRNEGRALDARAEALRVIYEEDYAIWRTLCANFKHTTSSLSKAA